MPIKAFDEALAAVEKNELTEAHIEAVNRALDEDPNSINSTAWEWGGITYLERVLTQRIGKPIPRLFLSRRESDIPANYRSNADLHKMALGGSTGVLQRIIEEDGDPNRYEFTDIRMATFLLLSQLEYGPGEDFGVDFEQFTLFQSAAAGGHVETLQMLLNFDGVEVLPSEPKPSALMIAAAFGNVDAVRFLLTVEGLNPRYSDEAGWDAMDFALFGARCCPMGADCVRVLSEHPAFAAEVTRAQSLFVRGLAVGPSNGKTYWSRSEYVRF